MLSMQLIETIRPMLNDSRVPHPLETVSIEFILRENKQKCEQQEFPTKNLKDFNF